MPRIKGQVTKTKTDAEKVAGAAKATKERRDRFLSPRGAGRGEAALKAIGLWGDVSNLKSYTFTEAEVSEVNAALEKAVANAKERFAAALKAPPVEAVAVASFSFMKPATPEAKKGEAKKAA